MAQIIEFRDNNHVQNQSFTSRSCATAAFCITRFYVSFTAQSTGYSESSRSSFIVRLNIADTVVFV
jgi:hypothetical protein